MERDLLWDGLVTTAEKMRPRATAQDMVLNAKRRRCLVQWSSFDGFGRSPWSGRPSHVGQAEEVHVGRPGLQPR